MTLDYKKIRQSLFAAEVTQSPPSPPSTGQYEDGTWYWLDETGDYGDSTRHPTQEAAVATLNIYCSWLMGEVESC